MAINSYLISWLIGQELLEKKNDFPSNFFRLSVMKKITVLNFDWIVCVVDGGDEEQDTEQADNNAATSKPGKFIPWTGSKRDAGDVDRATGVRYADREEGRRGGASEEVGY